MSKLKPLAEAEHGLVATPGCRPDEILGRNVGGHQPRRHEPSVDRTCFLTASQVIERLAVRGYERIKIREMAHEVAKPIGNAGRHHAAVAVANEDHVLPGLVFEHGRTSWIWVSRSIIGWARWCRAAPKPALLHFV